jgi:predicted RNA binding protein YcfA (HicA-like mRNA interferase family)
MTSPLKRQHVRRAVAQGWRASLTKGSHVRLIHTPTGAVVFCSGTPSDRRAAAQVVADLRRALRKIERNQTSQTLFNLTERKT